MLSVCDNEIEVISKHISNTHIWKIVGFFIGIVLTITAFVDGDMEGWELVKLFLLFLGFVSSFVYSIISINANTYRFSFIDNKQLYCQSPSRKDSYEELTYQTNIDCLSYVVITDSEDLILYNREQEQDYVFDLSFFERDDIQYIINILSEKVEVKIEDEIAKENNLKLPSTENITSFENNIPFQKTVPTRRRRVVTADYSQGQKNKVEKETISTEKQDDKKPQMADKKGRKLEL